MQPRARPDGATQGIRVGQLPVESVRDPLPVPATPSDQRAAQGGHAAQGDNELGALPGEAALVKEMQPGVVPAGQAAEARVRRGQALAGDGAKAARAHGRRCVARRVKAQALPAPENRRDVDGALQLVVGRGRVPGPGDGRGVDAATTCGR